MFGDPRNDDLLFCALLIALSLFLLFTRGFTMARTLPSQAAKRQLTESMAIKSLDAVSGMTEVKITAEHQRMWGDTATALMWVCPGFTRIMYSMCNPDGTGGVIFWTKDVPIAATDGLYIILNPDTFFGYTLHERVFIVAHEIMHMILNHCNMMHRYGTMKKIDYPSGKSLPYIGELFNVAADYVINAILADSKVGVAPKEALLNTNIGKAMDAPIDVYAKLYKDAKQKGGQPGQPGAGGGAGQGQKGFDKILAPGEAKGKNPQEVAGQRDEGEWKAAAAAAVTVAKAQGKLPAALERFFKELLQPVVDWREALPAAVARSVGGDGYTWRHLDRRLICRDIAAPGRARFHTDAIALAIDTSGSIGQVEIDRFFTEMRGILEDCRPRTVYVIWCDAKVHKVDEIEDSSEINSLKPKGGGGTDFRPPFDWLRERGITPDTLVYFTDLCGPFPPTQPSYPVIWASTVKGASYPWGNVVDLPLKD